MAAAVALSPASMLAFRAACGRTLSKQVSGGVSRRFSLEPEPQGLELGRQELMLLKPTGAGEIAQWAGSLPRTRPAQLGSLAPHRAPEAQSPEYCQVCPPQQNNNKPNKI